MYKFRTMRDAYDRDGVPLADADRITGFGRFLRSTSLDELPGLWSVLKGDMSLVGPRPLLMEYLPLYSLQQARRHEVRPGITGWAQVNRSEEHTSELQSLMRISYAVFCLKKKKIKIKPTTKPHIHMSHIPATRIQSR